MTQSPHYQMGKSAAPPPRSAKRRRNRKRNDGRKKNGKGKGNDLEASHDRAVAANPSLVVSRGNQVQARVVVKKESGENHARRMDSIAIAMWSR